MTPRRLDETMEAKRDEIIQHLYAILNETRQAHDLTADGQAILAMQALLRARRLGKQAIATLLGNCLSVTTAQADEGSLPKLTQLIGFAQRSLCPACRSEVGKKWKESENV